MQSVSLKFDAAFKELFSHEGVRKQFLSDVLEIPLEEIRSARILNPFLRRRYRRQKQGILDVALELNNDIRIDVELQIRRQQDWVKRDLFYLAKMYTDDLMTGDKYNKLRRCISISILDFNLIDGEKYHTVYRLRDEDAKDLTDVWEVHIIELRKRLGEGTGVENWIRLFNAKSWEDLDMIKVTNTGMGEAIEAIKHMSLRKSLRYLYEERLKEQRDRWAEDDYVRECGRQEGRQEGREKEIISLACKKYVKGIDAMTAAEQMECDPSQVQAIYDAIDRTGTSEDIDRIYDAMGRTSAETQSQQ